MRLLPGEGITAEKPRVTGRVHGRASLRQPGRLLPGGGCYQGGGMTAAREGYWQGDCSKDQGRVSPLHYHCPVMIQALCVHDERRGCLTHCIMHPETVIISCSQRPDNELVLSSSSSNRNLSLVYSHS